MKILEIKTASNTKEIVGRYAKQIVDKYSDYLEALILVGSFSREEEIVCENYGKSELLSDIEFLAVIQPGHFGKIQKDFTASEHHVSLGFTTREHLKRFRPYIFTIEMKRFGKVLWGNREILNYIPNYAYEDISPIDGFILFNNRIVEQLIVWQMIARGETIRHYDIVKGYIQIVNAYLTVNKRYKSLYPEKREVFNNSFNGNEKLKHKVNDAFSFLKNPDSQTLIGDEAMRQWQELRGCFKVMREDMTVFIRGQFLSRIRGNNIIKGWGKVLLNEKKRALFSFKEIMANFFRTSPQFLIYEAAIHEYFSERPDTDNIARIIKRWEAIVK